MTPFEGVTCFLGGAAIVVIAMAAAYDMGRRHANRLWLLRDAGKRRKRDEERS